MYPFTSRIHSRVYKANLQGIRDKGGRREGGGREGGRGRGEWRGGIIRLFFWDNCCSMGSQWVFYSRSEVIVWVWGSGNCDFGGQVYKTEEMMKF